MEWGWDTFWANERGRGRGWEWRSFLLWSAGRCWGSEQNRNVAVHARSLPTVHCACWNAQLGSVVMRCNNRWRKDWGYLSHLVADQGFRSTRNMLCSFPFAIRGLIWCEYLLWSGIFVQRKLKYFQEFLRENKGGHSILSILRDFGWQPFE